MRTITAHLKGRVFDTDGHPMTPSFGRGRQDRVYRYYVSNPLLQGRALVVTDGAIRRVPAGALEDLVLDRLQRMARRRHGEILTWDHVKTFLTRIEIHASAMHLLLDREALYGRPIDGDPDLDRLRGRLVPGERIAPVEPGAAYVRIILAVRMKVRGGRTWLTRPDGGDAAPHAVSGQLRSAKFIEKCPRFATKRTASGQSGLG